MKGTAWLFAALLCCVLTSWAAPGRACGVAWGGLSVPPKPADEQVLMVWDRETQVEHFVRQVRFSDAKEPFGFVVPTPTRPTLHEIKKEPWDFLTKRCNPKWSGAGGGFGYGIGLGGIGTMGHGAGRGKGAVPPVTVLEEKQLGDFKAFVLEANDAKGFSAWLKQNRFRSTPELEAWLGHYIELKFYFVALRYEGTKQQKTKPGEGSTEELISKTVHISFKTPNPYYPYLEPLAKQGTEPPKERKLQVWFVSNQVMQPVARYWGEGEASGSVVRPWTEAYPCDGSVDALSEGLEGTLAESTKKRERLQVFADVKTSREGYGDVLLVPTEADDCAGECVSQRDRLAKLLEASTELRRTPAKPSAGSAPTPYLAPAACSLKPCGNNDSGWIWFGLPLAALGLRSRRRRRKRARALLGGVALSCGLGLLGCEKTGAPSSPSSSGAPGHEAAPMASSPPAVASSGTPVPKFELPTDDVAAHSKLVALLGGKLDGMSIPVQATDARTGIGAASDLLPQGAPSSGALAARCAPGLHEEILIRVEVDRDAEGTPIRVLGPLSGAAKQCVARAIRDVPADPLKAGVERFVLGFGPSTPGQKDIQQRFAYSFAYRGGPSRNAPRVRLEGVTVVGRLPQEVVQRIQRRYFGRFRFCIEQSKGKKLEKLSVNYVIDAEGKVKNVRSSPDGGEAGACIRKAFVASTFPKPEGGVVRVTTKFSFKYPD